MWLSALFNMPEINVFWPANAQQKDFYVFRKGIWHPSGTSIKVHEYLVSELKTSSKMQSRPQSTVIDYI